MFRQMNRIQQQLPQEEAIALLNQQPRGVLSLQGDDGYPYGVPTNFWYSDADGCIYFHSGDRGHKVDSLNRSAKASLTVLDSGTRKEGDWALTFRSVIVFGEIEVLSDAGAAMEAARSFSLQFTQDLAFIEGEIRSYGHETLCFRLRPRHITGKWVREA